MIPYRKKLSVRLLLTRKKPAPYCKHVHEVIPGTTITVSSEVVRTLIRCVLCDKIGYFERHFFRLSKPLASLEYLGDPYRDFIFWCSPPTT